MVWAGLVQCPNCGSPIDTDASVCPYCCSAIPRSAPWRGVFVGEWWWTYVAIFAGLAMFVVTLVSDTWFETHWTKQLLDTIVDLHR
jgi:hypothetical protein